MSLVLAAAGVSRATSNARATGVQARVVAAGRGSRPACGTDAGEGNVDLGEGRCPRGKSRRLDGESRGSVVLLRRVSVAGAIVIVAAVVGTLLVRELVGGGGRASLAVTVAGKSAHVVEGRTLAGAAARFGLHPRAGDVVDVNRQVLRAGAVAGSFLVDGRPASAETRLRSGDRITVVDGHDRREPLVRRVVRVTGGMASNPQFTVSHT